MGRTSFTQELKAPAQQAAEGMDAGGCWRVRRPEFGSVPGFVASARNASDDQHAEAVGPGEYMSPFVRPDAN